jgi:hypothetical protein
MQGTVWFIWSCRRVAYAPVKAENRPEGIQKHLIAKLLELPEDSLRISMHTHTHTHVQMRRRVYFQRWRL